MREEERLNKERKEFFKKLHNYYKKKKIKNKESDL